MDSSSVTELCTVSGLDNCDGSLIILLEGNRYTNLFKDSIIVWRLNASPNNALAHAMSSASVVLLAVEFCFFDDHSSGKYDEPV